MTAICERPRRHREVRKSADVRTLVCVAETFFSFHLRFIHSVLFSYTASNLGSGPPPCLRDRFVTSTILTSIACWCGLTATTSFTAFQALNTSLRVSPSTCQARVLSPSKKWHLCAITTSIDNTRRRSRKRRHTTVFYRRRQDTRQGTRNTN